MIAAYRKIQRMPEVATTPVMPATRAAIDAAAHDIRDLGDGRAQLYINGQAVGIYTSAAAAFAGADIFKRMGVVR